MLLVVLALLDFKGRPECKGLQAGVRRDLLVLPELRAAPDLLGLLDRLVVRVPRVTPGRPEVSGLSVRQVLQGLQDLRESKDLLDLQVPERKDPPALQVRQDRQVARARKDSLDQRAV